MSPINALPKKKVVPKETRPRPEPPRPVSRPRPAAGRHISVRGFLRDVWSELHKVRWPTRMELRNLTLVVIGLSVAVGLFLGTVDFIFAETFKFLLQLVGSGGF